MDKSVSAGSVKGIIAPPSSKSYAQRALAAALLAEGDTMLRNLDFCDDTLSAISVIETLGAKVERLDERRGILHIRRHLAATPLLKGLTDFRPMRIAMLRAEKLDELFSILDKIEETYG